MTELKAGTAVRVYYNPAKPADALLSPGIDSSQLFLALFLMPFNAVMAFLLAAFAQAARLKWFPPPAGGLRIEHGPRGASIRLDGWPALGAGLAAIALAAFVGIFAVAIFGGFNPPLSVVSIVWIVVLAAGVATTLRQFARNRSDRARLLLDEGNAIIVLPALHGRTARLTLPFADLTALRFTRELTRDSEGSSQTKYALAAKGRAPERLALWSSEPQTRGFATWLATKLRLPLVEA